MATSYLPQADADRVTWLNNFKTKLTTYGASLGFTAAEITAVQNDANMYQYVIGLKEGCRQAVLSLSALSHSLSSSGTQTSMGSMPVIPVAGNPPASVNNGVFNRIAVIVKRIKAHASYTPTLGQEFNIVVSSSTVDPATMKPVLTVKVEDGVPRISWKKGKAHGLQIYVDRRDNNGFVPLAMRVSTVFIDTAPLPASANTATWDYKAKYIINDDEVGLFSDTVSADVNSLGL